MQTTVDRLNTPSWIFRVWSAGNPKGLLHTDCVIETLSKTECFIKILTIHNGITMRELRPKLNGKLKELGFKRYKYTRSYDGVVLTGKVR